MHRSVALPAVLGALLLVSVIGCADEAPQEEMFTFDESVAPDSLLRTRDDLDPESLAASARARLDADSLGVPDSTQAPDSVPNGR